MERCQPFTSGSQDHPSPGRGQAIAPTMDEPGKPLRRHSWGAPWWSPWSLALLPFSVPTVIRQQSLSRVKVNYVEKRSIFL
jgi:hypothetical protein